MTDLSIDREHLEQITRKLESAAERLVLQSRVVSPGAAGLQSPTAEDALAEAARQHAARAEALHTRLSELAERPTTVADRFAQQDRVLGETD
ncbi:hypothetical protein MUN74_04810 [Agromyces endophyticus]|uniref:hypothetical protein n=1 Tax=Agromyces sp. H17E-10 TaxID=2932244 RepID=UPI001FD25F34|nr:hypothetical protein [Agromyces sp. H17E-10]UOQ90245.1 hypothetical protein MUN74_04810 [Agromyces sp. H17E-10]